MQNRTCNVTTKQGNNDLVCGAPSWTESSQYCQEHFETFYPGSFTRINADTSQLTEYQKYMANVEADNTTHSLSQMIFSFGLMWKMRKQIGMARLEQWFRHAYGKNPLVNQAWDQIAGMVWRDETGLDPISGAFEDIGF